MMRPTMPSCLRLSLLCFFLVGFAAVPLVPVSPVQAGLWDKLGDVKDRAKEKAIETKKKQERPCSACGKIIYIGTKCVLCQTKAAQRNVEEAGSKVVEYVVNHEKALAEMAENARTRYGTLIWRAIHDPESRRRACEAIGIVLEVCRQVKAQDKEGVYRALRSALDLTIQTDSGVKTLGELAIKRLIARFPYLEGTDIAKDPAAPLAALLTIDGPYFWKECQIIKSGDGYVSIEQAICGSSSFNIDKADKALDLAEATESVANSVGAGKGSAKALEDTIRLATSLNR